MKKIFILLVLLSTSLTLSAGPISEARAREIAEAFFAENATTRSATTIELEWAGESITAPMTRANNFDDALIYIYTRGESDGFVIIAGDDSINPIIAYSFDTTIDSENMADATKAIIDAWGAQIKAVREGTLQMNTTTHVTTRYGGELLYETALWNQDDPYNREAPVIDGERSVTGCVATAMSIICYYNEWPKSGVGTTPEYTYEDAYGHTHAIEANTLGRTYNYNYMLADYNNGFNTTQANAVAALMKDVGTAVHMQYHPDASGAYDIDVPKALINHFGYSKQCHLAYRDGYDSDDWYDIMRENLNNFGPTYYSGGDDQGGHAFVVDGYAPDNYFHFNFGWGGYGNGHFLFPEIEFYDRQAALLNLEPDKDGTSKYRDNILLYSYAFGYGTTFRGITSNATKYAANSEFSVTLGYISNYGVRVFNGEVALVHCDKNGEWKKQLYTATIEGLDIWYSYYEDYPVGVTLDDIEEGDLLRIYFKSSDSDEWIWARAYNSEADDEIEICATPERVAENLIFTYDKTENAIYLYSPDAYQVDIDNGAGNAAFFGHTTVCISSEYLGKGDHIIKISCSGRPYELKVKL